MFPNDFLPPLENDIEDINSGREGSGEVSSFYKEIKEKLGLGDMHDKGHKTFIKAYLEGMNKNYM